MDYRDGDNRRSGMILNEDFNVFEDQKDADDELTRDALAGKTYLSFGCQPEVFH